MPGIIFMERSVVKNQAGIFEKGGFEERESQDVIPVAVGKDEMIFKTVFLDQAVSQLSNPGSGVDDQDMIALGSDLQTSGIPAILEIFISGDRNRTAGTPAFDLHLLPPEVHLAVNSMDLARFLRR